jgi:hypothetical protein
VGKLGPAVAVAVVTGILVALELLRPVHGIDAGARAAVETAIAIAAVFTARLLIDIFDRSHQLRELLFILGVFSLALAGFSDWAGPMVASGRSPASGGAVRLGAELIGAVALAAAALVPRTSTVKPLRGLPRAGVMLGVGVVAAGTLLANVIAVHSDTSPSNAATAAGGASAVAVGVQVLAAVVLAVASLAFVARSWRAEGGTGLLAAASLLLAAAGVQFVTVPTVPADWVTPREGMRLVAFALLLGGICLRYAKVQRSRTHTAVCAVREEILRDLHDGLAQDLACITTQAQRLDCYLGPEDPFMLATRSACAELRAVIMDLTAPPSEAAVHGEARHVDVVSSRRAGNLVVHVSGDSHGVPQPRPAGTAVRKRRRLSRGPADWSLRAKRRRPASMT